MPAGETENSPSPWTIDSLHQHLVDALAAIRLSADTQFAAQGAAREAAFASQARLLIEIDRRYEQRFEAQETAVSLALTRVDNGFAERLKQVREETRAALEAADKAIMKAEASTEKRFESVNEFRAQLADQATKFMPRIESEQRMDQVNEKIAALDRRLREDTATINSRLDLTAGRGVGLDKGWGYLIGFVGIVGGIIGIILAIDL